MNFSVLKVVKVVTKDGNLVYQHLADNTKVDFTIEAFIFRDMFSFPTVKDK